MFLSRGDRDLGVAFQTHLVSQALSRGEAKDSILLSSRDGYLLEPTKWPKGSQASCGVWRVQLGETRKALMEYGTQLLLALTDPAPAFQPGA